MNDAVEKQNEACARALEAELAGRLEVAIAGYRHAIHHAPRSASPYLYLGYALERSGEAEAAVQAYSLAADRDGRVVNAWRSSKTAPGVRERSRRADRAIREHFTRLHRDSLERFQRLRPAAKLDRIHAAIWCQTHARAFEYRTPLQRPHLFYVPDLDPSAEFDTGQLPGLSALEDAFEAIRNEYLAAQPRTLDKHRPYVDASMTALGAAWEPLRGTTSWSSLDLYKDGVANEKVLKLFPRTWALLRELPLFGMGGAPLEILFSVLDGNKLIPPHYGLANTDATVHLPLITPENTAIRVLDTVHAWREGQAFAFDDSFEHESWNRATAPRVNLLFGLWHPDLSQDERDAVGASFEARDRWNRARRIEPIPRA